MSRARLVEIEKAALLSNERIQERAYLLYSRGRGAEDYLRLLNLRRASRSPSEQEIGATPISFQDGGSTSATVSTLCD